MNNNNAERSLFSRLSMVCVGLSFIGIPLIFGIIGIILGIIGLLKQEEQKYWAIIGIIICLFRVIAILSL